MIIAVFGAAGAGKSTMVINMARIAAEQGQFVGIVSAETRYGSLQRELGKKVPDEKSLKQAILDNSNIKKYAVMLSENIFFFSMSDHDDISSHVVDDPQLIQQFIKEAGKKFDVLFVDCTDRATDDLTAAVLQWADNIINIIESTPKGIAFFNAHHLLRESFYDKTKELVVLNKNIATNLNKETAEGLIKAHIDFVIPYFPTMHENSLEQKTDKKYTRCLAEIWQQLEPDSNKVKDVAGKSKTPFKLPKISKKKAE